MSLLNPGNGYGRMRTSSNISTDSCNGQAEKNDQIETLQESLSSCDVDNGMESFLTSWKDSVKGKLHLDVLLPTGVLVETVVEQKMSVYELKSIVLQKVFDHTKFYPLTGRLTNIPAFYTISYICQEGSRVEVDDDEKTLSELNIKLPFIKMNNHVTNRRNTETQINIGSLIGLKLSDLEKLANAEVNEFRWNMKIFASNIAQERKDALTKNWKNIIAYQFPALMIDKDFQSPMTEKIIRKENNKIQVNIKFDGKDVSCKVESNVLPSEIISFVATGLGIEKTNIQNYCLKVFGKEEYLVEERPVCHYISILDDVLNIKKAFLVLKKKDDIIMKIASDDVYTKLAKDIKITGVNRRVSMAFKKFNNKSIGTSVTSVELKDKFMVEIGQLKLNRNIQTIEPDLPKSQLFLRISIYHGNVEIVDRIDTYVGEIISTSDESKKEETQIKSKVVDFNINVSNIPRMARLCFGLYKLGKRGREKALAWANRPVFNYKRKMKNPSSLYMWDVNDEELSHDLLNPYKTSEENKDFKETTATAITIDVSYVNTFGCSVVFPKDFNPEDECFIGQNSSGRRKTIGMFSDELGRIARRDPLHPITKIEKDLLRGIKHDCRVDHPTILPRIIDCVDYTNNAEVRELHALLTRWPIIPMENALQLLDYAYPDERVHEYAVKCLNEEPDEKIEMYLCQLVQALKHQNFYDSSLTRFLLKRALKNQRLGHRLFWNLRSETRKDLSTLKLTLVLEAYLLAAPEHVNILKQQRQFINRLTSIDDTLQLQETSNAEFTFNKRNEIYIQNIKKYFTASPTDEGFISIKDPTLRCHQIEASECALMKSKKKPQKLVFNNFDSNLEMEKRLKKVSFIFKTGDDLRQDSLIMQMIQIMDNLWKRKGLDLKMTVYNVVPTQLDQGLIEFVQDAETVCRVQMKESAKNARGDISCWMAKATSAFKQELLYSWLETQNPDPEDLKQALDNFMLSCTGYTVAMYVLGIGDRHNDNIMIKKCGKLFHIDFGHVMGKFKSKFGIRRERSPMLLPSEFIQVIQKGGEKQFEIFREQCEKAFLALREKGCLLISLLAMMLSTGMPELQSESDLEYMRDALQLNDKISEEEALAHFRCEFNTSLKQAYTVTTNWWLHTLKQLV
eukprot:GFUD01012577.1.p1 GENE.GFUD01012577.1~~GFUD01012577.1.p1  ORF type:complete len:1133 (+),score=268.09 GFUD01012577.1:126-3524(+)